jgi:ribonuclease R
LPRRRTDGDAPPLDKARVLEALAKEPKGSKRDLARALHVKGSERVTLKRILKELESEGTIARDARRRYATAGDLPDVGVLEITGQDPDGDLLARPQRWEENEPPPRIIVVPGRDSDAGPALGIGERVLARLSRAEDGYEARVIKRIGAAVHRVLGVYREHAGHGRIVPIDRKTAARLRTNLSSPNRWRGAHRACRERACSSVSAA